MTYVESARLAKLAVKLRLLATSMFVPFAEVGGMIAFATRNWSHVEAVRRACGEDPRRREAG
ncbi:MAG: hypothetical protein ACT4PQ_12690 [Betaproteobacteria bacterium]